MQNADLPQKVPRLRQGDINMCSLLANKGPDGNARGNVEQTTVMYAGGKKLDKSAEWNPMAARNIAQDARTSLIKPSPTVKEARPFFAIALWPACLIKRGEIS